MAVRGYPCHRVARQGVQYRYDESWLGRRRIDLLTAAAGVIGLVAIGLVSVQEPRVIAVATGAVVMLVAALASPRWFTLAILPLLLLIPPTIRLPYAGLPDFTPLRAGILLALGAWILWLGAQPREERLPRLPARFTAAAVAFTLYVIAIAADGGASTLSRGVNYSIEALAPVVLLWLSIGSRRDLLLFIDWLLVIGSVAAVIALKEQVTQTYTIAEKLPFFFHAPARDGGMRVQGIFPHPLVLGTALALLLPIAVTRAFVAAGRRRLLAGGAVVLFSAALFFTSSRGPWLAAVVALLVLAALLRGGPRLAIMAALISVITAVAFSPAEGKVPALIRGLVDPTSGQAAGAFTIDYRKALWTASRDYAETHPFGAGPGQAGELSFMTIVGGNTTNLALSIDNAYAKYAIEIGPIGLGLFLLMVAAALRAAWRARRARDQQLSAVATAIFAGQIGMLVASFTVATFSWAQLSLLFWLLTGAGLVIDSLAAKDEQEKAPQLTWVAEAPESRWDAVR